MTHTLRWCLLPYRELSGADNMAVDQALAESMDPGRAVLRFYGWSAPTVSFGRNQPAAGRYDIERATSAGIRFVRRPTGGRAVLHHREVTYSVVFPARRLGGLRDAYRMINRALVAGLAHLGIRAALASAPASSDRPSLRACFDGSAGDEVVVDGRKLLGSAQAKLGQAVLQHGSLLLYDDQSLLATLTGAGSIERPPVLVSELIQPMPSRERIAEALARGFEGVMGTRPEPVDLAPDVAARAAELCARYQDPAWTWRR